VGALRRDPEQTALLLIQQPAKMLAESRRGAQNQSIVPSVATSAVVCRSPIRP